MKEKISDAFINAGIYIFVLGKILLVGLLYLTIPLMIIGYFIPVVGYVLGWTWIFIASTIVWAIGIIVCLALYPLLLIILFVTIPTINELVSGEYGWILFWTIYVPFAVITVRLWWKLVRWILENADRRYVSDNSKNWY